eukprot:TRINITY_DN6786_c0_g1_i1.p1 TRINITY_DN6786_c0_g1~~TRINITY_DN6786_c0_g1_i1.p1  ORF type:complete len:283 (+),score=37.84 TRINITY_DN6786_c0_g1_i1:297-1145(+)
MKSPPETYKKSHPRAYRIALVAFKKEHERGRNQNVERFLMGRQVLVVLIVFFLAKLTTIEDLGVANSTLEKVFLDSGLMGALIVVVFGQLTPQIFAAKFPIAFMQIPGMIFVLGLCMGIEYIGLTHTTYILAKLMWVGTLVAKRLKMRIKQTFRSVFGDINKLSDEEDLEMDKVRVLASTDILDQLSPKVLKKYETVLSGLLEEDEETTYASPKEVTNALKARSLVIPQFLLLPDHKNHVPPHICACALLLELIQERRRRADDATDSTTSYQSASDNSDDSD